jgi:hypothetical protein
MENDRVEETEEEDGKRNKERKDGDIREEENVNYWKSLIGNLLEQIKKIKKVTAA